MSSLVLLSEAESNPPKAILVFPRVVLVRFKVGNRAAFVSEL
jgi:hypothetical protein